MSVAALRKSTRADLDIADGRADLSPPEVSVVMPCLNESETLQRCIEKAQVALQEHNITGEIIVADNGSTDGSQGIAARAGARVVHVDPKGYGSALMGGIAASRGKFIVMGDADDSYDFGEIPKLVAKLRDGVDLVQGCRLPSGGGRVLRGAMPFTHRWLGNPMLSLMVRNMFWSPIHDVYCGLRGFRRDFYERLDMRCTGMEFAAEMIAKAGICGAQVSEVAITLHPDGRKAHRSHLKTLRDGWRTLRFFLLYCPRWLFFYPGAFLAFLGVLGYAVALPGLTIGGLTFDAHTLLFASLSIILGYHSALFAIFTKTFAIGARLLPVDPRLNRLFGIITLEKGLMLGAAAALAGVVLLLASVNQWRVTDFGRLDYAQTMRWAIPGVTLTALGIETILASFFISILGLRRQ